MTRVSHAIDRFEVSFDDPNLVANAGLLLTATLFTDDDTDPAIGNDYLISEFGAHLPAALSRATAVS